MDPKYIEIAKNELREEDLRKSQALAQFREWIDKHPFLSKCPQDDVHLLKFLRVRKYNVDAAIQTYERNYLVKLRFPQFFDIKDEDFVRADKLIEAGFCVPLSGRNKEGQKVVLFRYQGFDPELFNSNDAVRAVVDVITILLEEEETQIAGFVYVFDNESMSLKHCASPSDFKDFFDYTQKYSLGRHKKSLIMNLPPFANFIMELAKSAVTEKIRNRLFIVKNNDELKNHIDVSMLPKEYGGSVPLDDMLKEFLKFRETRVDRFKEGYKIDIPWDIIPRERAFVGDEEAIGSFRKLEID